MKSFLKIAGLLALMVLLLLAAPALVGHLCHGLIAGTATFGLLVLGSVLILGLAVVGGGTAVVIALVVLLSLVCALVSVLLPVALPVLLLAGLITLIVKATRRKAPAETRSLPGPARP